jgi:hypothetical protein
MSSLLENAVHRLPPTALNAVAEHKEGSPHSRLAITSTGWSTVKNSTISTKVFAAREIKQMARKTKITLLESINPQWRDFERLMRDQQS